MTPEQVAHLQASVLSGGSSDMICEILKALKQKGITQAEVQTTLEAMRHSAPDEATEDRILEVLDIVAGWCRPRLRIWDEQP